MSVLLLTLYLLLSVIGSFFPLRYHSVTVYETVVLILQFTLALEPYSRPIRLENIFNAVKFVYHNGANLCLVIVELNMMLL